MGVRILGKTIRERRFLKTSRTDRILRGSSPWGQQRIGARFAIPLLLSLACAAERMGSLEDRRLVEALGT